MWDCRGGWGGDLLEAVEEFEEKSGGGGDGYGLIEAEET